MKDFLLISLKVHTAAYGKPLSSKIGANLLSAIVSLRYICELILWVFSGIDYLLEFWLKQHYGCGNPRIPTRA